MGGDRRTTRVGLPARGFHHPFGAVSDLVAEAADLCQSRGASRRDGGGAEKAPNRSRNAGRKTKSSQGVSQPAAATGRSKNSAPVPREPEIVAAVASLYTDRLRPFGRILRKRLAERAVSAGHVAQEADLTQLKKACNACRRLILTAGEGGEWCAILNDQVEDFIDIYNKEDVYPEQVWIAATEYFHTLPDSEALLPGGRYACAHALASRNVEFLQGYTLGHICHFVELALSSRKVLGYLNGGITSYSRSLSCTKDKAAASQSSCAQPAYVSEMEVASWEVAKTLLKVIMTDALKTPSKQVPLSNIKRIFRADFEIELSETTLGHSRLSEFLQDERLRDICTVRLLDQGYFVIPTFGITEHDGTPTEVMNFSWADAEEPLTIEVDFNKAPLCQREDTQSAGPLYLCISPEPSPQQSDTEWFALSPRADVDLVQHTFIHAPATPLASAPRPRSQSLPRSVGRARLESPCLLALPSPDQRLASPLFDLIPPTPELCALRTPDLWAGLPSTALDSVPESQRLAGPTEKFSWLPAHNEMPSRSAPVPVHYYMGETSAAFTSALTATATRDDGELSMSSVLPPPPRSQNIAMGHGVLPLQDIGRERPMFGFGLDELLGDDDEEHGQAIIAMASPSPFWSLELGYAERPRSSAVQISLVDCLY